MVRRPGRRPVDPDSPVVDVDRVLADDSWIDQVRRGRWPTGESCGSTGAHRTSGRHRRRVEGEPLLDLLDEWRTEVIHRPLRPMPKVAGPVSVTRRPRSLRPVLAVAAAIGAIVVGSASVGAADADPDSPFWPITRALWPDRAASAESAGAARLSLDEARTALGSGRTREAQAALWRAADELRVLPAGAEHDHLQQDLVALWVAATPTQGTAPSVAGSWPIAFSATPPTGGVTQLASVANGSAPTGRAGETAAAPIPITVNGQQPAGGQSAGSGPAAPVGTSSSVAAGSDTQSSKGALGGSSGASAPATDRESPPTPPPPAVAPADPGTSSSTGTTASTPPSATEQSAPSPPPTSSSPPPEESTPGATERPGVDGSTTSGAAPKEGAPVATPVDAAAG